jgi:O-methyltransferase involved in polyketide biosynthesis
VFFFNDVLHYLNPEEQQAVLQRAVDTLLPGGILFIRDGIEELSIKHKNTKRTEELSTKFFKFNKTTNELHFLSAVSIEHFANTNGLGFELVEHSTKTSNVLMILRKP